MDYTFKNAVEELSELSRKGADIWHGEQLEEKPTVKGLVEVGQAEIIIQKLLKEYAPTVEMTQQQKDLFLHFKETTWFSLFLAKFNDPEFGESLPDLTCFDGWGVSKERENDLLTAWLQPESIKVVD
ncbi:hypothetical protein [uncultured Fructobacillus sp.]|uniref:hypothetical protein n=1 Tax=uncultured Fructobacillus sp. TaxID=591942 RepID=UPI002592E603|nr:hypothetical protein [uncultured Fructobacillus sp.]